MDSGWFKHNLIFGPKAYCISWVTSVHQWWVCLDVLRLVHKKLHNQEKADNISLYICMQKPQAGSYTSAEDVSVSPAEPGACGHSHILLSLIKCKKSDIFSCLSHINEIWNVGYPVDQAMACIAPRVYTHFHTFHMSISHSFCSISQSFLGCCHTIRLHFKQQASETLCLNNMHRKMFPELFPATLRGKLNPDSCP